MAVLLAVGGLQDDRTRRVRTGPGLSVNQPTPSARPIVVSIFSSLRILTLIFSMATSSWSDTP